MEKLIRVTRQIWIGYTYWIKKDPETEILANYRRFIVRTKCKCAKKKYLGLFPYCENCGCVIEAKIRCEECKCPKKNW